MPDQSIAHCSDSRAAAAHADGAHTSLGNGELSDFYHQTVEQLDAAVYTCDAEGRILFYNRAAAELWGREPKVGHDLWCGSVAIFYPDGSPMPLDQCPMAITLREGRGVRDVEIVVERPDGARRNVLPFPS